MVERKQYLDKLIKSKDLQIIKVVTGIRRCGKSTLLKQFRDFLLAGGVDSARIIEINYEKVENEPLKEYHALYNYVKERLVPEKMTYVFLDEIQEVPDFQRAIDSLFTCENIDIYITGSNAKMLSSELSTLLSGRYIEIKMLPLSFKEYFELVGGDKFEAWNKYFYNGGLPYAARIEDETIRSDYISGIYNTVLLKDIVQRNKIQDVSLLESVVKFLFANIGSIVSSKKISDSLVSYGRKTTPVTVEHYIEALKSSFVFYEVNRYDIKGKQFLKSLEKYYLVDIGFRTLLLGKKNSDIGHILENIVYLELLRRGNTVHIGKIENYEIDFIADKNGSKAYYQVSASVLEQSVFAREITPLKLIKDNYPKYIISMDRLPMGEDGIDQVNIVDFLLSDN